MLVCFLKTKTEQLLCFLTTKICFRRGRKELQGKKRETFDCMLQPNQIGDWVCNNEKEKSICGILTQKKKKKLTFKKKKGNCKVN